MELETQTLNDGCVLVSLSEGQHTARCLVSSMHLVEGKRRQLEQALQRMKDRR